MSHSICHTLESISYAFDASKVWHLTLLVDIGLNNLIISNYFFFICSSLMSITKNRTEAWTQHLLRQNLCWHWERVHVNFTTQTTKNKPTKYRWVKVGTVGEEKVEDGEKIITEVEEVDGEEAEGGGVEVEVTKVVVSISSCNNRSSMHDIHITTCAKE